MPEPHRVDVCDAGELEVDEASTGKPLQDSDNTARLLGLISHSSGCAETISEFSQRFDSFDTIVKAALID